MHLLVADDNDVNLKVACAYLKALGVPSDSIQTASNGLEATQMCDQYKFDLVFMDIQMPIIDGVEATQQILSTSQNKPKIVALTANACEKSEKNYLAAGMEMVIYKPVNKTDFEDALKLAAN